MNRAFLRTLGAVLVFCGALAACSPQGGLPNFADLVEDASPSVVNISTVSEPVGQPAGPAPGPGSEPGQGQGEEPQGDWYHRFFDEGEEDEAPDAQEQSLGSGFILWEDGYVLTNRHVVKDSKEIIVRLSDRRQLPAKIVGMDERSDLALLKIEATGLPAVKLGDVTKLRVGEWVLAIGSPFGFDYSVTAGIVSAKGRSLISEQYVPFVQTDVAINPGNSGGPLFNTRGEVIGVNSQIFSETGGYMGVSFAIPIDVAAKAASQLKERGKVTRGWLGVVVQEVDRGLAQSFGMKKPEGALIARVVPGGPADQAGLRSGDIILSYNGQDLATSSSLPPLVGNSDPGDKAQLKLIRDGKQIDMAIEVGTLDTADGEAAQDRAEAPVPSRPGTLGVIVRALTTEERSRGQIVSGGVWVARVDEGAGREAGLRNGDIILSLGGSEIDSPDRFAEVVGRLQPGQSAPLLVQRRGTPVFLALEIPERASQP
jgi:serine protease Do